MRSFIVLFLTFFFFCANGQNEFRLERVKTIPASATVNDILVHKNDIFIATDVGLYQINAENLQTRLISKKSVDAVCYVVKDQVWASVENKYLQNMSTGESTFYNSPGIQVRDLEYSKGKIWIASNQGILTVVTRSNELGKIEYDKRSGLPSNNVSFIHVDKQKQMWIGTDQGIVFINKKDKWKTYEKKLSMEAMHYNHEGLWLVSNEEMWVVDDYNRWYPAAIDRGLRKGKIRDITADSTGRLYMASEILVRYDPYDETIESYADNTAIVSKVCTSVESDRDNRIWLGTKGGGLFLFGFADQATTVEDLMAERDRRVQEAADNGVAEVEERLVAAPEQGVDAVATSSAMASADVAEDIAVQQSSTAEVVAMSGVSSQAGGRTYAEIEEEEERRAKDKPEEIIAKDRLVVSSEILSEVKCSGDNVRVRLNIVGGTAPYSISWEGKDFSEQSVSLEPGSHKVVVSDSTGQSVSQDIIINGVEALALKVANKRSPSALGRKDGNVKVQVSGGTAPYSLSWSNGESGDRARRLENGIHTVSVTDANGCAASAEVIMKAKIMADLDINKVTVGQKLEIKNIYYEADSTEVTQESFESLEEVYAFLTDNEEVRIEIGGHTNNLPTDEYCDRISTARAKSVAAFLFEKGITTDRVSYKGYGKRDPIASNETKEGRRRNQRVEIEIISK